METQCDQMTRLFIHHWATCNNGNLDNSKKVPKIGSTFYQILITHHLKIAKELKKIQRGKVLRNPVTLRVVETSEKMFSRLKSRERRVGPVCSN